MNITTIDHKLISFFRKISSPLARFAIFVVFFWFGILKVIDLSPAGPLVEALFNQTISFMSFPSFYLSFGWFEVVIGILFLIPKATRIVIVLLLVHMILTIGPLVMLPEVTWTSWLVPTLEGQYIIKNLAIIAAAIGIAAHLTPMEEKPTAEKLS